MGREIKFERGSQINFAGKSAKGEFVIHGDPAIKIEKPYTIVKFPGGHIELTRTSDNKYWVHVGINHPDDPRVTHEGEKPGKVVNVRIDARGRYTFDTILNEIVEDDVEHIAFLVESG